MQETSNKIHGLIYYPVKNFKKAPSTVNLCNTIYLQYLIVKLILYVKFLIKASFTVSLVPV
jgi:hypothetical protein